MKPHPQKAVTLTPSCREARHSQPSIGGKGGGGSWGGVGGGVRRVVGGHGKGGGLGGAVVGCVGVGGREAVALWGGAEEARAGGGSGCEV